jgi:site-specific recombinase XerD
VKTKPYQFASIFSDEFCDYLKLRKSQGHLHLKDTYILKLLDQYLVANSVTEKTLSAAVIEDWIHSLSSQISVNTKIVYISHYSQFAKYLSTLGISTFVPERPMEDKSYTPYVFSNSEIERIFAAADNVEAQKFPIILRILYGCGLRLGEALSLRVRDVELQSGILKVSRAKGNKDRLVPMDESLSDILSKYIALNCVNATDDTLLFPNTKSEIISDAVMRYWFGLTLKKANIQQPILPKGGRGICLHCMRHTFAVNSFRKQDHAGVDMYTATPFLSTYMGHDNILGTQTYLHMTAENSVDVIEQTAEYTMGLFPEVPR